MTFLENLTLLFNLLQKTQRGRVEFRFRGVEFDEALFLSHLQRFSII